MDTFKLNIVNTLVVVALVAVSMCMPVVAASLAHSPATGSHATDSAFPAADQDSNAKLLH